MPLNILEFVLGPLENNTYLAADENSGEAVVIDPASGSRVIAQEAASRGWNIKAVWLTHAHFDHIAGINELLRELKPPVAIALHPDDQPLYRMNGGASLFGVDLEPAPLPSQSFFDGQVLQIGDTAITVHHTPGHTTGHVVFHAAEAGTVFCGDLIFYHGVGRTDLPGGSHSLLLRSIRQKIFQLPPATRLLSGHGPETTVQEEIANNPFL